MEEKEINKRILEQLQEERIRQIGMLLDMAIIYAPNKEDMTSDEEDMYKSMQELRRNISYCL